MRKRSASFSLLFALCAAHAQANDYVCELALQSPAASPTMGNYGYIAFYTSSQPNCGGATTQWFLCSKGATNKYCGVGAQYSEASLIGIYETMRSAEAEQHPIVPSWSACINAGGSCVGSILLYPAF
ncbi:MAG TPA: hypothetical protein VHE32_01775 [Rhodanobacteraceae bacterium]|nr:hypothetical protein [Rhodanobacteraceae bacterium]